MQGVTVFTEKELLQQIQAGEKVAFRIVYDRYWERLYEVASAKVAHSEIAEEMVQDVFADIWERRQSMNIMNLEHYLFRAIKNKILDHIRAQIVRRQHEDRMLLRSPAYADSAIEEELAYQELEAAFRSGLDDLPEKTRAIFQLSRVDQLSTREISDTLGIPQRTVSYHIAQALTLLRVHLKDFISGFVIFFQLS